MGGGNILQLIKKMNQSFWMHTLPINSFSSFVFFLPLSLVLFACIINIIFHLGFFLPLSKSNIFIFINISFVDCH